MEKKRFQVTAIEDYQPLLDVLLDTAQPLRLITLRGDLGSGKTTFSKYFFEKLGVLDAVTSPTFSIINEYDCAQEKVYHMDFYRILSVEEAQQIGLEEYLYSGSYCLIEWPEVISPLLPLPHLRLDFQLLNNDSRQVDLSFIDQ